eukprot:TRINITY_DN8971_c0_g1_i1.p1 TRINITY_DN8971_c0_g1~~TRINITY_DN8971_c0_g1_i1.p1  ORF type:complete len:784 (+),score=255.74 TRINITY_DN8971_c0_g1_i1:167-2353(+)
MEKSFDFDRKAANIVLENEKVSFEFGGKESGYGILQIVDKSNGNYPHLIASSSPSIMWTSEWRDTEGLGYFVDNTYPSIKNHVLKSDSKGSNLTFTWSNITFGLYDAPTFPTIVKLSVFLPKGSGLARFSLEVNNKRVNDRQPCLWSIKAPQLNFVGGKKPESDSVVLPKGFGIKYNPSEVTAEFDGVYPSALCTYQFFSFCNEESASCLYYGAHDGQGYMKMMVYSYADSQGSSMHVTQTPMDTCAGKLRPDYTTPWETLIGVHSGDHYDSSNIYREFAMKSPVWTQKGPMKNRTDVPEWYKDSSLWISTGLDGGKPQELVKKFSKLREILGTPFIVHYYMWHRYPFDSNYPDYFPARKGYLEAVYALRAVGVQVVPYINGRLWDYNSPSFITDNGMQHIAKLSAPRMSPSTLQTYMENYASKQNFAVACPGSTYWPKKISSIVNTLFLSLKSSGVYVDQIGSSGPRSCSDPSHGHTLGGGNYFAKGDNELLSAALAYAQPHKGIIVTEDNSENFMASLSGYLSLIAYGNCRLFPMYQSIYGGYMHTFGRWFVKDDYHHPSYFNVKMAQMFVLGSQLGWAQIKDFYPFLTNPSNSNALRFLKDLIEYKSIGGEYLKNGRLMRPLQLEGKKNSIKSDCTRDSIQHAVWMTQSSLGIFFVNADNDSSQNTMAKLLASSYGLNPANNFQLRKVTKDGSVSVKKFKGNEEISIQIDLAPRSIQFYTVSQSA